MNTFAKELRAWRKALGLVQKQAAGELGISKRTYEGWEYGRTSPGALAKSEIYRRMSNLTKKQK